LKVFLRPIRYLQTGHYLLIEHRKESTCTVDILGQFLYDETVDVGKIYQLLINDNI